MNNDRKPHSGGARSFGKKPDGKKTEFKKTFDKPQRAFAGPSGDRSFSKPSHFGSRKPGGFGGRSSGAPTFPARSGSSFGSHSSSGSRGGRSFGGPRSGGSGGSRFGGGSRGGRSGGGGGGKRGFKGDYIDEKRFINKAMKASEDTYVTQHTFADFGLHEKLLKNLAEKGFIKPSPIQDQAIQVARQGKDVIGIASTGTGKTAAFLLPLINKLVDDKKHKVMILAPTRELALQIEAELQVFTKGMGIFSVSCVGGSPIMRQIRELARGVHVVIGTPGRVQDLIARKRINMEMFGSIVLDEADRMLDMGFVDDMRYILGLMPKSRQSLFFSATFSHDIKKLCGDFLREPVTVEVKSRDTAASVEQNVVRARGNDEKIQALHDILISSGATKVLIFREMKRKVDELADDLKKRGFKAFALHGDMRNRERERAVAALASGAAHILIATDVAARGIDIKDITHVINYDIPNNYETYIHRIGRTGRAGQGGIALTFV